MLNNTTELANEVARTLLAGERAVDVAVADISNLPGAIIAVRLEAELPFGTGQGALSDVAEALNLMIRARHHMARAHSRLREAGTETKLFGDVFPCPESGAAPPATRPEIRLVA